MKLEDMSQLELIAEIKQQRVIIDNLTLSEETAWKRWKNSNELAKSYMQEFSNRGLQSITISVYK